MNISLSWLCGLPANDENPLLPTSSHRGRRICGFSALFLPPRWGRIEERGIFSAMFPRFSKKKPVKEAK